MKRRRIVLFLVLSIVLVMPLVPTIITSSTIPSTPQEEEYRLEVEQDPNENVVPAGIDWNWAATSNLFNDPYGTANVPSNLAVDDGSLCRLTEEYASSSYQLDLRFRTTTAVYAHQYLHCELRMEFSQIWSLQPEDLKFYVSLANAAGNEGTYTYIGQLSSPGIYSFDLDLFDDSITTARHIFIRVLGAIETGDGTGNSYDFDYLGIAYKAHVPYFSVQGWDTGLGYIFPHYGVSGKNYAVFSATYTCLDGGSELSSFYYNYYDQIQAGGWTVSYLSDHFVMEHSGNSNDSWASLVTSACYITTTSTSRTFTFGVLIEWSHPRGFTFSAPNTFAASSSEALSLEVNIERCVYPGLSMQIVPTISESRVNSGSPCTYSGDVYYTGSSSHTSPLASEVDNKYHTINFVDAQKEFNKDQVSYMLEPSLTHASKLESDEDPLVTYLKSSIRVRYSILSRINQAASASKDTFTIENVTPRLETFRTFYRFHFGEELIWKGEKRPREKMIDWSALAGVSVDQSLIRLSGKQLFKSAHFASLQNQLSPFIADYLETVGWV